MKYFLFNIFDHRFIYSYNDDFEIKLKTLPMNYNTNNHRVFVLVTVDANYDKKS